MKIVLSGLPFCGKSTVFKALVGKTTQPKPLASGKIQLNIGTLEAKDPRLDNLAQILNSEKVTHPKINLVDLVHLSEKAPQGINAAYLKEFEVLALVLGTFSSKDPASDLTNIEQELILADISVIQSRIERIDKERKARTQKEEDAQLLLLQRAQQALEEEKLLKALTLSRDEQKMLAGFQLLTLKPMMVIANIAEGELKKSINMDLEKKVKENDLPLFSLCAELEAEIKELAEEERAGFLQEMGLDTLSSERFIQICFKAQDLISFFTVVGKEARSWPIRRGSPALEAAGCVHSDMERGFIRAEVINYSDFLACGSFAQAKEKGLLRLEGKDYSVQDGDIINFKFSV